MLKQTDVNVKDGILVYGNKNDKIEIYDASGRFVKALTLYKPKVKIDLSKGVYFIIRKGKAIERIKGVGF